MPKAKAEFDLNRTYWNRNGKYQDEKEFLHGKLVPAEGPASTPHGELLRCFQRLYYDYYNNGAGNIRDKSLLQHASTFVDESLKHLPEYAKTIRSLGRGRIRREDLEVLADAIILKVDELDKGPVADKKATTPSVGIPIVYARLVVPSDGGRVTLTKEMVEIPQEIWNFAVKLEFGRFINWAIASTLGIRSGLYCGTYDGPDAPPMMPTTFVDSWGKEGEANGIFVVPVPKTYVPYQGMDYPLDEQEKERLMDRAQHLWKVLDLLGISGYEAYKKGYTLNYDTWDKLHRIALQAQNDAAVDIIVKYK